MCDRNCEKCSGIEECLYLGKCVEEVVLRCENEQQGWRKHNTVLDSGAAASVAPPNMAPNISVLESEGSRRGQCYLSASGERIPNLGQQRIRVVTEEGNKHEAVFQVAEVTRPLSSVSQICDRGHVVIFDANGGSIVHKTTGRKTRFDRRGGTYELNFWVHENMSEGFSRQGS